MNQPESPHLIHAKSLFQKGQLQESEEAFQKAITSCENIAQGHYGIGMVRLNMNDLNGAMAHFQTSLQYDPTYANTFFQLGALAEMQKNIPAALSWYRRTLTINPQHIGALQKIAFLSSNTPSTPTPTNKPDGSLQQTSPDNIMHLSQNANVPIQGVSHQLTPSITNRPVDILLPQQYGAYDYLREDTSLLARQTLATIDAIRFGRTRPSLTAYLDVLPPMLFSLFFLVALFVSFLEFINKISGDTSLYLFPGTFLLGIVRNYLPSIHVQDPQAWLRYSWLAIVIILVLFTLRRSLKTFFRTFNTLINALTTEYTIDKGRLQITWGIFRRATTNIELLRVRDVTLSKSFINRLTGDGTLFFMFDRGGPMRNTFVKGLTRGRMLEEIFSQLLNLVSMLRSNSNSKGIIQ